MSRALRRVRDEVRLMLNDMDARSDPLGVLVVDKAISSAYLRINRLLPAFTLYTASAFTVSAGAETFTLPQTVAQWTGNDGGAEYAGQVRIRLRSTGSFLKKIREEEMDAYKHGRQTIVLGIPSLFSLDPQKDQSVNGRCEPGAKDAQVCDLWASLQADALEDFIGSGTDDMDDVELQMSRLEVEAVKLVAAADILAAMSPKRAEARGLDKSVAGDWATEGWNAAYGAAGMRHDIEDTGETQRRVG